MVQWEGQSINFYLAKKKWTLCFELFGDILTSCSSFTLNIEHSLQEFIGNGEQNVDGDGGEQAKVSCLQSKWDAHFRLQRSAKK